MLCKKNFCQNTILVHIHLLTFEIQYVELLNVKNTQRRKTGRQTTESRMLTNDKKKLNVGSECWIGQRRKIEKSWSS